MKLCPLCKRSWEDGFRVCPIDGLALQSAPAESDPYTGKTIGQVRIGQKIADGDQGPVYHAEDPVLGAIAVQFIDPERLASPVLMEAFADVVKLAAKITHPNVIRIYSLENSAEATAAVLMEYVAGAGLDAYRRDNPSLDVQQALRIIRESAEGVLAAHRLSMLHGWLQPSRILITPDGSAKVGGFHRSGLRDDILSSTSPPAGLIYLAPERLGIIRDIPVPDYRADVYSLGAILHELLTGKPHYEAKSLQDLGAAMQASPPLPASLSNPQISPTLSRVILKALSQHPSDRHRSVEDFIREIDAARQPIREPEMSSGDSHFAQPRRAGAQDDSGLFAPMSSPSRKEPDRLWPADAQEKKAGDESFFGWFKTRVDSRAGSKETERKRPVADDSFFPRGAASRRDDVSEERTVVVSGAKNKGRRRSAFDSVTNFGRQQDLTGTDALPRRRFSSKAYLVMGICGILLIGGLVALFLVFGGSATGRLTVESTPPGAQIFLNDEYRGNAPLLIPELKADSYRLRLQLDGYETAVANVDIGARADIQRTFVLTRQAAPPLASLPPPPLAVLPPPTPPTSPVGPAAKASFEAPFNEALRSRSFLPPAAGNAWEILQSWRQKEGGAPTAALEQAQKAFCRELERFGLEKLDQRDFQFVRGLLDQIRSRMPGQSCAGGLQTRFDNAISQSLSDLRTSLNAAMNRQSYVTPETDNALKYARLILHIDSQDAEAKSLEADIYTRALDQARAKSEAHDHQEALNIYLQLKDNYPNPPGGQEALSQSIDRERQKLSLLTTLKIPFSVQVRHDHSFFRFGNRECTGVLRIDGFSIEYQSTGEHSFKMGYDVLKSVSFSKGKIVIEGSMVPGAKIELEQVEKNPNPSLAEVYAKIEEYRKLRDQYLRAKAPNN